MKTIGIVLWVGILFLSINSFGQGSVPTTSAESGARPETGNLAGHWKGSISLEGKTWTVWLDVRLKDGKPEATVDFPDFGAYALSGNVVTDATTIKVTTIAGNALATFDGKLSGSTFSGEWKGLNVTASFELKRVSNEPSLAYVEEPVTFQNGDATLAGTLVRPSKPGKHPAIVFTRGSGNQTRTQSSYRSSAYLFARNGVAALIYDRRGTGASKGGGEEAGWDNLAADAIAGVKLLRARIDIDRKQVGVSGFSQGGWVSPLAAIRFKEIAFVLVGSTPAITPEQQNNYNVEAVLRERGLPEDLVKTVMSLRYRIDDFLHTPNADKATLEAEIAKYKSETWFRNALLPEKLEPYDAESKKYIAFDPAPVWQQLRMPVCSLWGEKDDAVPALESKTIMGSALKKAGNKNFLLKIFPKAGHGVSVVRERNEAWDFPRLAKGYQETMLDWVLQSTGSRSIQKAPRE
jgi:dienelactone hydrolase